MHTNVWPNKNFKISKKGRASEMYVKVMTSDNFKKLLDNKQIGTVRRMKQKCNINYFSNQKLAPMARIT